MIACGESAVGAEGSIAMTSAGRQIVFINAPHTLCHCGLLILPTAVLAMVDRREELQPELWGADVPSTGMAVAAE